MSFQTISWNAVPTGYVLILLLSCSRLATPSRWFTATSGLLPPTVLLIRRCWQDFLLPTPICTEPLIYWTCTVPCVYELGLKGKDIPLDSHPNDSFIQGSWGGDTSEEIRTGNIFYTKGAKHVLVDCKRCFDSLYQKDTDQPVGGLEQ